MRKFKDSFGTIVDLDDAQTYKNLPNKLQELQDFMLKEIGFYTCFCGDDKHCEKLIQVFVDERKNNLHNAQWFKERIIVFQDAINSL